MIKNRKVWVQVHPAPASSRALAIDGSTLSSEDLPMEYDDVKLTDFIDDLLKKCEAHPKEQLVVWFETISDCDDSYSPAVCIGYWRDPTPEEQEEIDKRAEKTLARQKADRLRQFQDLKKEFK